MTTPTVSPDTISPEKMDKVEPEKDLDQTKFAAEEPLFEDPSLPRAHHSSQPKSSRWWLLVVLAVSVVCLIAALLLALSQQPRTVTPVPTVTPSPTVVSPQLQSDLEKLQAELDAADPTRPAIVFPQVDMDIRLDPATKTQ